VIKMSKKVVTMVLALTILVAVPLFAGGHYGKGYKGGSNQEFVKGSGSKLHRGYGDGSGLAPKDGTGFGAKVKGHKNNCQRNMTTTN
jgi:hypothetical protein